MRQEKARLHSARRLWIRELPHAWFATPRAPAAGGSYNSAQLSMHGRQKRDNTTSDESVWKLSLRSLGGRCGF